MESFKLLLESSEQSVSKQHKVKKSDIAHHELIAPWVEAMESGTLNGKVFSVMTVETYTYYVESFITRYEQISFTNLKKALSKIPPANFAKKDKIFKAIKCFAKFLIRENSLDEDFLIQAKSLAPKRHLPLKRHTLTLEDVTKLKQLVKSPMDKLMLTLLLGTGLRASEACALRAEDINLQEASLTVQCGKGGKRRRLGLNAEVLEVLKCYELPRKGYVFLNSKNHRMNRNGLYQRLERLGKEAGVKVSPHALRRAFVTLNANQGRSLVILQRSCGHSDIKTTMGYCLTSEEEVIKAMKGW